MELTYSNGLSRKLIREGPLLAEHNSGMQSQWQIRLSVAAGKQHRSSYFLLSCKAAAKKTCEIPSRNGSCKNEVQEVVPLLIEDDESASQTLLGTVPDNAVAIRLTVHEISVEISTGATQEIIQNTLSALRFLC